ncbi:MAG: pitrilysin family protein [Cyclobacteriaceae bacterium]|nr:pitrilysin family protein [Cytophagales bacterium]MCZ8328762.1 pitrilysin family protein [Cyclobacteriaceae bacterium]
MLNRQIAPPFTRSTYFHLLTPEKFILANGLPVYVMHGGEQEVMRIEWIFNAGKINETKIGLAHFTANQIDKGTQQKNSLAIADGFETFGAHVEVNAGNDFTTFSLYVLTHYLPKVLPLVNELLQEAIFPATELTLAKDIALQQHRINLEKTAYLAGKYFRKSVFGEHPYGNETSAEDISQIEPADLNHFKENYYFANSVFVSGKFSAADVNLICKLSENLRYKPLPGIEEKSTWPSPDKQYIEKEKSVQTTIRMGTHTINRKHPDFIPLMFTTHVLGGYFGSRLMKNIREEKGLTYGIFGVLQPYRQQTLLSIGADVNKENRLVTIDEIHKELTRLKTESISNSELENARNYFIGSLQSEVATVFSNSDKVKSIILNQMPDHYYQDMINRIDKLTPDLIQETASKYYDIKTLTTVSVG